MNTKTRLLLIFVVSILSLGCSNSRHPELRRVKGHVVYQGQPVSDAVVAFYNEKSPRPATGTTDASGDFYLTTFDDNDGALPGEHTVVITKTAASETDDSPQLSMDEAMTAPSPRIKTKRLLPAKYASVKTSPLRYTVADDGPNDFSIDLDDAD